MKNKVTFLTLAPISFKTRGGHTLNQACFGNLRNHRLLKTEEISVPSSGFLISEPGMDPFGNFFCVRGVLLFVKNSYQTTTYWLLEMIRISPPMKDSSLILVGLTDL